MKQVRVHGANDVRVDEIEPPRPGPRDAVVRVAACGICRTDLHVVEGDLPLVTAPIVPGHQVVGRVERLGLGVSRFAPGDRVGIWAPNLHEWIVAAIGVQSAGGAIVTLNTRMKGGEAGYVLRKSGARMLCTMGEFLGVDYAASLRGEELPALERTTCPVLALFGEHDRVVDAAENRALSFGPEAWASVRAWLEAEVRG